MNIYNSEDFREQCPCKYIMAFNICRLNSYRGYSNLIFNNKYSMRSLHFTQKITKETERLNIETIYNKTDILNTQSYNVLINMLPASTIVSKNKRIKDMRKSGVEQVSKMLKSKRYVNNNESLVKFTNIFGKKYANYTPVNSMCAYVDGTIPSVEYRKKDKISIIESIMRHTERVKTEIECGKTVLSVCPHKRFTKEFHQLRAADEAAHRVLTCLDCGRIFNVKS